MLVFLPMLVDYCSPKLFAKKIPMHRKWVRLKYASHILHDALFFLILIFYVSIIESSCLARGVKRQRLLGGNPILFLYFAFCYCLVINNSYSFCLDVVLCFKLAFVPSRTFGKTCGKSLPSCCKKQKLQRSQDQLPFFTGE